MRPSEFSSEDIIAAGKDLLASGRSVTGFALRQKVGGGNPNRLKAVWDEHQAGSSASKKVLNIELPSELSGLVVGMQDRANAMLYEMTMKLHQKAYEAAESRLTEAMRTATEMREQAEKEMADAAQTVEQLEEELAKMEAKVLKLETELDNERKNAMNSEVRVVELQTQLNSAGEKANLEQKVDSLQAQMELLMVGIKPLDVIAAEPSAGTKKKSSPKTANLTQ